LTVVVNSMRPKTLGKERLVATATEEGKGVEKVREGKRDAKG